MTASSQTRSAVLHVLVVDDEPVNRETQTELLKAFGLSAVAVGTLDEALIEIENPSLGSPYDAVLTDINLLDRPGDTTGVELARQAKQATKTPLAVVGYSAVVKNLPQRKLKQFDDYFARADDDADDIVAGVIRASARDTWPSVIYPLTDTGLLAVSTVDAQVAVSQLPEVAKGGGEEMGLMADYPNPVVLDPNTSESLLQPLLVLLRQHHDEFELVHPEHPCLIGHGQSMDDAVDNLLSLMRELRDDLAEDGPDSLGSSMLSLKALLDSVLS